MKLISQPVLIFVLMTVAWGSDASITNSPPHQVSMQLLGYWAAPPDAYPSSVSLQGDFAHVLTSDGVEVIDVVDPSNPHHVAHYGGPGTLFYTLDSQNAFLVRSNSLIIVDVSNPRQPVELVDYDIPHPGDFTDFAKEGDHLYLIDQNRGWPCPCPEEGLMIIDVTNPSNPTRVPFSLPGFYDLIKIYNGHAFLANTWGDDVSDWLILSLANPSHPSLVTYFTTGWAHNIHFAGSHAYIFHPDWDGLADPASMTIVDVSDPSRPQTIWERLSAYRGFPLRFGTEEFIVRNGTAFTGGIFFDVSDLTMAPQSKYSPGILMGSAGELLILRNPFYFPEPEGLLYEMQLVDSTVPTNVVGSLRSSAMPVNLAVTNDLVFVVFQNSDWALAIFDITPNLSIRPETNGLTLSWSTRTGADYSLEQTARLDAPEWSLAPSGTNNPVNIPVEMPSAFFRLKRLEAAVQPLKSTP